MPSISMNAYRVFDTPKVYTYVGGSLDYGLVCRRITITPNGATADFDAPLLNADSDKSVYYTNPVVVYADNNPAPVFRGYFDDAHSGLRGDVVTFVAQSPWAVLRDMKIFTPAAYNLATTGGLTTQNSPIRYFLADNPYTDSYESRVWQPIEIIAGCFSLMDSYWLSQVSVWVDPKIPQVVPVEQEIYRMKYNATTRFPYFVTETKQTSPFPDIVFRAETTFGEVMDFAAEMAPGTQVFEVFDNVSTSIYLAYPQSFGAIVATAGAGNEDWRDTGANVMDMAIETSNGGAVNRVIATGAPASSVVTLMSETATDTENQYITGLVPDWELFTDSTTVDIAGMQGASAYNYNETCTYAIQSIYTQTINQVMANPNIGKPGQPEYIKGYEDVGRKYRLPNWFEFADIETKGDLLIDGKTGESIGMQVFFEAATYQGMSLTETPTPVYKYTWYETKNFRFDQKHKTITLGDVIITDFIGTVESVPFSIDPSKGPKLARIAVTFTYSHPNYTLVADSYLDAGSTIPVGNRTAITTGQCFTFEDESLGYTQISNINMPIYASYAERIPITTGVKRVEKVPLETQAAVTYDKFIVAATASDSPDTYNAAGVLAFITENTCQANKGGAAALTVPAILRDDSARLRQKCRMVQYIKSRKPRNITVKFNQFIPLARRGMVLGVNNINYLNSFAGDCIDTVTHDMIEGYTTIRTTNQPADDMVQRYVS